MERELLLSVLEALLATSREPIVPAVVVQAMGEPDLGEAEIADAFDELGGRWAGGGRGLRLEKVAGGWRFVTPPELDPYLRSFHGVAARQRLSQAALETLAIVAYRQPVTLPEVNFVRGANSSSVIRTLLDRGLIRMAGRKAVVGKPFLYRTTKLFLQHFGLDRIEDLPEPEALSQDDHAIVD